MLTVTIHPCSTDPDARDLTHSARTDDPNVAVARAVRRHYGPRAWFWQDNGLSFGRYGQIAEPAGLNQHRTLTGRVRIDVADRDGRDL